MELPNTLLCSNVCLLFVYVIFYLHVYSAFEFSLEKSTQHFRKVCTHTFSTMLEICLPLSTQLVSVFFLMLLPPFSVGRCLRLVATEKRLLFLATENGCLNLEFVIRHIRAIVLTRTEIIFYSNI